MDTPLIDAHLHVFAKVSQEFPRQVNERLAAEDEAPVERLLEEMENHHVEQAVLVQIGGVSLDHIPVEVGTLTLGEISVYRTDNTDTYGRSEIERVADGDGPVAVTVSRATSARGRLGPGYAR